MIYENDVVTFIELANKHQLEIQIEEFQKIK